MAIAATGCTSELLAPVHDATSAPTEQVFINGEIYTVNPDRPWAEAVYVANGEIHLVGSNEVATQAASADAIIIDLGGRMMMPGIHDVHVHPLEVRSPFSSTCRLDSQEVNPERFIPNCSAVHPISLPLHGYWDLAIPFLPY